MTKNLLLLCCLLLFAALDVLGQKSIAGKVLDESGRPLPGVNILVKGTSIGTVSDSDGGYALVIPADQGNTILTFSFIGYLPKEIPVGNQSTINIDMVPDVKTLSEIVVVGYGTMKREDISGAVSSVQTKDLPQVANTSIDQLLQGRAPGLNISQRSAQPGGGLNINIRGAISPQGNNSPLYVIDGVPIFNNSSPERGLTDGALGFTGGVDRNPLNSINPADIESIEILKDASSTAIYGASAANGVVLITTKRGKAEAPRIEYRGSYTVQTPKDYIELFGPKEFMQQHNRLAHDRYLFLNDLAPYGNNDPTTASPFSPTFSNAEIQGIVGHGTDWLDLVMRDGKINDQSVSISGGSENTKVYTNFNFFDNDAILVNSNLRRYTGRINLDQTLGSRIKLSMNITGSQINNNNASTGTNSGGVEKYNMLQAAFAFSPTREIFNESGAYTKSFDTQIMNPAAFLIMKDRSITTRLLISPNIEVKILDDLKLNVIAGADRQNSQRSFYLPRAAQNFQLPNGMAQKSTSNIENYSAESYITYNKGIGESVLGVVLGAGIYRAATNAFNVEAVDFFTDAFQDNNLGVASGLLQSSFGSSQSERNRQSLFTRINYSLKDKYIFTFTGRYDGDSEFAANKKFGFFPGVSAAWKISNEDFLSAAEIISTLKLRVGAGQVGNALNAGSAIALYASAYNYPVGTSGTIHNGVALSQLVNPNLTWETNETINVGLDVGLWNDRVSASIDVYQRTAKDLLDFNRLPSNNEVGRIRTNVGSTRTRGIELAIRSVNVTGPLTWTSDITATTYESYWVKRNLTLPLPAWVNESDPYTAIYGWKTDGIITGEAPSHMPNANPGNIKYVDINNDGKLNGDDVVLLGQSAPRWNIGLANTFTYKNFDFNFFIYGMLGQLGSINSIGRGYDPQNPGERLALSNSQNVPTEIRRVWTADNPTGDWPGLAVNPYSGANPSGTHDFYLQKRDFVRLKNITLGYTLSRELLSNTFIRSVRIFADVQNLAVFSGFEGFDPEFSEVNPYPQALSTTLGLNVGF